MWDKKKTEVPTAVETMLPPVIARVTEPPMRGTQIGRSISIVGDIYSEEDLYIDGEVEGAVEASGSKLTVGPNGKAKSNIKAQEVVVLGQVQGDIDAVQKVTIRRAGSLVGNIRTTGIVIDDDAYFKGGIDIVRKPGGAPGE